MCPEDDSGGEANLSCGGRPLARREWLAASAALMTATLVRPGFATELPPEKQLARAGDLLAWPSWEEEDRLLSPDDLSVHAEPLLVYPRDPDTGVARERSRLNQILILRFAEGELDEGTAALAVDGVIAFSGICTHTACGITGWKADELQLVCPCHHSSFDPRRQGKRVAGPAPRALPMLPIRLADGVYQVAGEFTGKVGATTT